MFNAMRHRSLLIGALSKFPFPSFSENFFRWGQVAEGLSYQSVWSKQLCRRTTTHIWMAFRANNYPLQVMVYVLHGRENPKSRYNNDNRGVDCRKRWRAAVLCTLQVKGLLEKTDKVCSSNNMVKLKMVFRPTKCSGIFWWMWRAESQVR